MASDQKQQTTDLWQQRQQDKAKHGEVVARWPQHAMANPCDELDGRVSLRVRGLPDRCHSGVEDLATSGDRRFAFAAELASAVHALPIPRRHGVTQC